ncbi:MAG: hypothetical protein ACK53Y_09665, partial [bacterium]
MNHQLTMLTAGYKQLKFRIYLPSFLALGKTKTSLCVSDKLTVIAGETNDTIFTIDVNKSISDRDWLSCYKNQHQLSLTLGSNP